MAYATLRSMDRDDTTAPSPLAVPPVHSGVVRSIITWYESGLSPGDIAVRLDLPLAAVNAVLTSPLSRALSKPS